MQKYLKIWYSKRESAWEVALSTINYLAVVYETDLIDDKEYLRDSHLYILNKVDREWEKKNLGWNNNFSNLIHN